MTIIPERIQTTTPRRDDTPAQRRVPTRRLAVIAQARGVPQAPDHVGVMETRPDEDRGGTRGRWACSCGAAPERWGSVRQVVPGHHMHVAHARRREAAEALCGMLNEDFAQLVGSAS
jgi:hypothetical protein